MEKRHENNANRPQNNQYQIAIPKHHHKNQQSHKATHQMDKHLLPNLITSMTKMTKLTILIINVGKSEILQKPTLTPISHNRLNTLRKKTTLQFITANTTLMLSPLQISLKLALDNNTPPLKNLRASPLSLST
jgi:hypothetical protein